MSEQMVGIVIDRLLTDEDLRLRFAVDRIEALADLTVLAMPLTPDEIDLFIHTDPGVWFWSRAVMREQTH
jgi:hypothetical protein